MLFVNETLGFAVGGDFFSSVGGIFATIDGGKSWNLEVDTGAEQKGADLILVDGGRRAQYVTAGCARAGGSIWSTVVDL